MASMQFLLRVMSMTILLASNVKSANILAIFPTASYSHQMPLLAVTKALAERGHNLTVITPNPLKTPLANHTDIDISFSYTYWKPKPGEKKAAVDLQRRIGAYENVNMFYAATKIIIDEQLKSEHVQNLIKYIDREKPHFDLVITEDLLYPAYLGFVHKLGYPPLVSLSTISLQCAVDLFNVNPCNPSYIPDLMTSFSNKMSFWERVQNYFFINYMQFYKNKELIHAQEILAERYFNVTKPSVQDIARNRTLYISSSIWFLQYTRPVFPNTITIGPLHIGETIPLPKDLDTWVTGAKDGVIYFSLGSNMRSASLEESTRAAILTTFAKFPNHRVIWKWEDETIPNLPSNVICRKWLPQHDLLAHPNIKLFITQGGLQSVQEGIYFETPMLVIPFFYDQDFHANIIKRLGVGDFITLDDIKTDLYETMYRILYNETYMNNVKRISEISKTQMMSPRDSAVWWIEYVLKCKGDVRHLQPDYWHLTWYQYFGLDILMFILSPVILLLYGLYKLISKCRRSSLQRKLKNH